MANIKEIIGEEAFNALSEEKRNELVKKDFEDISSGAYVTKKKHEDVKKEAKTYKDQVEEREIQLKKLKEEYPDVEGLNKKIGELELENKNQKETHQKELGEIAFGNALEAAMSKYEFQDGAKEMVLGQIKGGVKFEEGKLIGFTEAMDEVKNNKPYLFKATPKGTGEFNTGGSNEQLKDPEGKEDIAAILGKQQAENMKGNSSFDKFIAK
jgi:hypothetical protein